MLNNIFLSAESAGYLDIARVKKMIRKGQNPWGHPRGRGPVLLHARFARYLFVSLRIGMLRSLDVLASTPHSVPPCPFSQLVSFLNTTINLFNFLRLHGNEYALCPYPVGVIHL